MDKLFEMCSLSLIQFLLSFHKLKVLTFNIKNLSWESELFFDGLIEVSIMKNQQTTTIEFKNHKSDINTTKEKQFDNLLMFRIYLFKKRIKFVNYRLSQLITL